jgi:hypothetical protein
MYSSSISRALCSDGMRRIKPLAPMSAPTGPFSEYAPQVAGIKRLPAYTCQPSGFVFRACRCQAARPGKDARFIFGLSDSRLFHHAREVRDRLFVDDRRFRLTRAAGFFDRLRPVRIVSRHDDMDHSGQLRNLAA